KSGKRAFLWDTLPGLAVMKTDRGSTSFVFQFRHGGKSRRITLRARKLEDARAEASALLARVTSGQDPSAERQPQGPGQILRQVVTDYLAFRGESFKSRRDFQAVLERHVLPMLGSRPYESITRRDLAALRDGISARAGKHAAAAALRNLNSIWGKYFRDYASDGFTWPTVRSPLQGEDTNGKGRDLSDREIREIWAACEGTAFGAFVRLMLLTGCRRSAAATLQRSQVIGDWSAIRIEGSSTKPGYVLPL